MFIIHPRNLRKHTDGDLLAFTCMFLFKKPLEFVGSECSSNRKKKLGSLEQESRLEGVVTIAGIRFSSQALLLCKLAFISTLLSICIQLSMCNALPIIMSCIGVWTNHTTGTGLFTSVVYGSMLIWIWLNQRGIYLINNHSNWYEEKLQVIWEIIR